MKILLDIGHPAHVHYFKNFYREMSARGHRIIITARNKECTHELLENYKIPYFDRGKGAGDLLGKASYLFRADYLLYNIAKSLNPDLFLSFCSPYAAQVSAMLRKPHIAFDDTEHARLGHLMYVPFTDTICTPYSYNKDLGKKQIRFNGFMELCALHPDRFEPDPSILNILDLNAEDKFVILRFVSWEASHDVGEMGIPDEKKEKLVNELSKHAKVFISSESKLPDNLEPYRINLPADKIHNALYYANLFVGEGATMAAESVILGTPAVYVNSLKTGYHEMLGKFELLNDFRSYEGVPDRAIELIKENSIKNKHKKRMRSFIADKIDVTSFMIWFVEEYPNSKALMQKDKSIQNNFIGEVTLN